MKDIAAVAGLAVLATFNVSAASGGGIEQHEVSKEQYAVLIAQCRYSSMGMTRCRAAVKADYRIGQPDKSLDCRTYSGVTVCGTLYLSKAQRTCAQEAVGRGLSYRRAEVECYAFG
ncbi:hypothetical protein ABGB18_22890 [Nonomuraea sp. B12E4]|uniref:hypothetical protein n=1 Tax=Nonomuraea sp. B12E4 TaxID=3153564 RepID=UPI00325CACB0